MLAFLHFLELRGRIAHNIKRKRSVYSTRWRKLTTARVSVQAARGNMVKYWRDVGGGGNKKVTAMCRTQPAHTCEIISLSIEHVMTGGRNPIFKTTGRPKHTKQQTKKRRGKPIRDLKIRVLTDSYGVSQILDKNNKKIRRQGRSEVGVYWQGCLFPAILRSRNVGAPFFKGCVRRGVVLQTAVDHRM